MKKPVTLLLAVTLIAAGWWWWSRGGLRVSAASDRDDKAASVGSPTKGAEPDSRAANPAATPPNAAPKAMTLSPEEKAARIAKIKRDYEEIMTKTAADYAAAGAAFPGGLSAYLRQLALLEREKWKDFADFLTPRELEDLQMREHRAGQLVTQWLGESSATDEQRRAVLRLQREFEDKYALIFDLAPSSLAARETERQALQQQILGVLGPDLFAAWLRSEGDDYGNSVSYAAAHGIRPEAPLEVWQLKNEFTRRRLEILVQYGGTSEAAALQANLLEQTRTKVATILGASALQSPASSGLTWLGTK